MRIISGIKPTGKIHLGNYFSAIKSIIGKQNIYEALCFVADYHSLTSLPNKNQLETDSYNIILDYIALGFDIDKGILFLQSSVQEHCELMWILSSFLSTSFLQRSHAYKDAIANNKEPNLSLLSYPVLMAADILIYDVDLVAVGSDQKQHIEIARELATKFNRIYENSFKVPDFININTGYTVIGIDGRKMSKSYNNTICIFDSEEIIKSKILSIATDSKRIDESKDPSTCNIFQIYKLFLNDKEENDLRNRYLEGVGYKVLKDELFIAFMDYFKVYRDKRIKISKQENYLEDIIKEGSLKARRIAQEKLFQIKDKIGLLGRKY